MNDTETRLRDYLQAAAATVPNTDEGPGLDETARSRHWPVVLAAAAIALMLALTATVIAHFGPDDDAAPAGPPKSVYAPPGPLTADVPKVPYTVTNGTVTTLHDGTQTVRLPAGTDTYFTQRVDGGWLVSRPGGAGESTVGILQPDGSIRQLGPAGTSMPSTSPDRTQVAVVRLVKGKDEGQILVLDIRTGKEVAHTPLGSAPLLRGWNKDGIWFSNGEHDSPPTLGTIYVWRPGADPHKVSVAGYNGSLAVPAEPGNLVVSTGTNGTECLKAGSLRGGEFAVQREVCHRTVKALYPVLSPDGRTMLDSEWKQTVDIATGKTTKLQLPDPIMTWPEPVFENSAHVLVLTERQPKGGLGEVFQQLFRCDVTSGACKLVMKDAGDVRLSQP